MYRLSLVLILAISPATSLADAEAGKQKAQLCLFCHKPGFATDTLPTLEGQTAEYLRNQIIAFKEKRRPFSIMQSNAAALSDDDIRDIVDYFSSQPPLKVSFSLDSARIADGKSAAESRGCSTCHRDDYSGNGEVPRLAGMDPAYSAEQIEAFGSGVRMHPVITPGNAISAQDAGSLGQYFAQIE